MAASSADARQLFYTLADRVEALPEGEAFLAALDRDPVRFHQRPQRSPDGGGPTLHRHGACAIPREAR